MRLSPERERFVRRAVEGGRYVSAVEAVEAALRLLEAREGSSPLQRAVVLGLEQALAGRSALLTADEVVKRSVRRERRR